jgi:hypothetical protein
LNDFGGHGVWLKLEEEKAIMGVCKPAATPLPMAMSTSTIKAPMAWMILPFAPVGNIST